MADNGRKQRNNYDALDAARDLGIVFSFLIVLSIVIVIGFVA